MGMELKEVLLEKLIYEIERKRLFWQVEMEDSLSGGQN